MKADQRTDIITKSRTEQEMLDLIITTASADERIRGAYLTGSRVNPNVSKDIFQDYDVVYVVHETNSFQNDRSWIDRFGKRLYMQYPEESAYFTADTENYYGWLMQFVDGNRLDLHVCTLQFLPAQLAADGMYRILMDKDGCLPCSDKESDETYWLNKPTAGQFLCTCNELWWCMNNVAKGLWREEVLYVLDMINFHVRPMLTRMLNFKIGLETDFSVSTGKSSKYMNQWLPTETYEQYLNTFSIAEISQIWNSVFLICDLFHETALLVSERTGYTYDTVEALNSRSYLEHIYKLPKDAQSIDHQLHKNT